MESDLSLTMLTLLSNLYSKFRWVNVTHGARSRFPGDLRWEMQNFQVANGDFDESQVARNRCRRSKVDHRKSVGSTMYAAHDSQACSGKSAAFERFANYAKIDTFQALQTQHFPRT